MGRLGRSPDPRKAALALVTDLRSIAAPPMSAAGRLPKSRPLPEQSNLKGGALPADALAIIKRFLAIEGDQDE